MAVTRDDENGRSTRTEQLLKRLTHQTDESREERRIISESMAEFSSDSKAASAKAKTRAIKRGADSKTRTRRKARGAHPVPPPDPRAARLGRVAKLLQKINEETAAVPANMDASTADAKLKTRTAAALKATDVAKKHLAELKTEAEKRIKRIGR